MQLTLTISVAILLGAEAAPYGPDNDFKFGSHVTGTWSHSHDPDDWDSDESDMRTKGDMGGQQTGTVTLSTGSEYGRGGSNYDTALNRDYSPCVHGCTGRTYHSWQEHTWKDRAEPFSLDPGYTVHNEDGHGYSVNSGSPGSRHGFASASANGGTKARRPYGGLWDERPAISGHDGRPGSFFSGGAARAAGTNHATLTTRTARPEHVKETNQEMMEDAVSETARQTGEWTSTGTGATFGPDTETDANGNPVNKGWGTHDFVDDGGHKGTYDNGAGTHTDATGLGGDRAWGSYESTDSTDWANAWAKSHLSKTWDNRRQYDKSGNNIVHDGSSYFGTYHGETDRAYPLDNAADEDHYRQVMSELHQNGGAQTYTIHGNLMNTQGNTDRKQNGQHESGTESQGMNLTNVEHFSWGIVPELAMDETARYFNGETWPRTQTRYRYSFQDWGTGSRANTLMSQIHNAGPAGAADADVHKYVWGNWSNPTEDTAHAEVGNVPGVFANVENGGDQTVYTPRLSYSWTKRKYNELKAATENKFHEFWDGSSGPAWEWDKFNHEGPLVHPNNPTDAEEPGASHRNWDATASDWAANKGPTGHALTTAIGDGKGYNTNDKYGYGDLDTKRTWRMNGRKV